MSRNFLFKRAVIIPEDPCGKIIEVGACGYFIIYSPCLKDLVGQSATLVFFELHTDFFCCTEETWEERKSWEEQEPITHQESTTAPEILAEAAQIMAERGQGYDKNQERSMAKIVAVFNALTGLDLTEAEGWTFMVILKMVRANQTPGYRDSLLDGVAYMALLAECGLSKNGEK
jgi:hypothetical protein